MANSAMSVVNQAQYSNFGSTFLGPVLSFFSEKLLLNQPQDTPIYFLAREGYWLQRAYKQYLHGAGKQRNSYYLLASRAFLFKLLLSDERSYMFSLKGDFCGSFYSLMRTRFLLSDAEITTLFTEQVFNSQIDLSKDKNKVVAMLSASRDKIDLLLAPIKCAYLAYLESIEVTSQSTLHLVDLGYSGTIQSLLGILLNKNTHGHYLISSNPGSHKIAGTSAFMQGYLKEGVKIGDGYLPLDRSMFLESLLTAPNGQFRDIKFNTLNPNSFDMYYGRKVASQRYFYLLEQVMTGALSLCGHNAQYAISFTPNELEALLESYLAKPNMIPHAVRHIFDIDDDVAGNGTVNAIQFFGLG
ncbi:HAD family hydrolase [Pseudoalteromonas atlantica]|uniref:HAD family hydrolase n=1 Tax=Pseudoalteromonas atlantica TaxID=288 RepID=UPI001E3364C2|nr:HAD family hydrolase [Pseudoalteromonas atlantica]